MRVFAGRRHPGTRAAARVGRAGRWRRRRRNGRIPCSVVPARVRTEPPSCPRSTPDPHPGSRRCGGPGRGPRATRATRSDWRRASPVRGAGRAPHRSRRRPRVAGSGRRARAASRRRPYRESRSQFPHVPGERASHPCGSMVSVPTAPLPPLIEAPDADPDRPTRLGLVSGLTLVGASVFALVLRGGAPIVGFAVLFLVFVPLERLFALRSQPVFRRNYLTDLTHFFVNNVFVTIGAIVLVVLAALPLIW